MGYEAPRSRLVFFTKKPNFPIGREKKNSRTPVVRREEIACKS